MLDAEGTVMGINTLVLMAGEDSTRYYAVSARRCRRAVEALVERRSRGEEVDGVRVVLRAWPRQPSHVLRTHAPCADGQVVCDG